MLRAVWQPTMLFAFFPPDPPTYDVMREDDGRLIFSGVTTDKKHGYPYASHKRQQNRGHVLEAPYSRFTLLYSHSNAADLGQMQELFIELRAHHRINVISLEAFDAVEFEKANASAIKASLELYKELLELGFKVFFVDRKE